jgi:Fe-S oxidoreductase
MTDQSPPLETALSLCTFCPSLCRQACPVATVEARDTVTPWGLMSLARHLSVDRVKADAHIAHTLSACNGCGACTEVCRHHVGVAEALVQVRAGMTEHLPTLAPRPKLPLDHPFFESLRARARFEARPVISLMPGQPALPGMDTLVHALITVCERLDVDSLSCGELARYDAGYGLYLHGHHAAFAAHAREVHEATAGAREIVVLSPEALYTLKVLYPRFGFSIGAAILHVSEFLVPFLGGAFVSPIAGRVAYHESCHLSRRLDLRDLPRQVLRRVLEEPLLELPARIEATGCCGGSGMGPGREQTALAMADAVIASALDVGLERIASFSTDCFASLSRASAQRTASGRPTVRVDHALTLLAEAVVREGAPA